MFDKRIRAWRRRSLVRTDVGRRMTFELSKDNVPESMLSLAVRPTASTAFVELSGELDLATVPLLVELVRRVYEVPPPPERFVLDLGGVHFIGAAGISALIWTRKAVGELVLRNPSPVVQQVLKITGTAGAFNIQ